MRQLGCALSGLLLAAAATTSHAYELRTHGVWTYYSFQASTLADPQTQTTLGINLYTFPSIGANPRIPFGTSYVDMGDDLRVRTSRQYERLKMPKSTFPLDPNDPALNFSADRDATSLVGWLMMGAIREDDTPVDPVLNDAPLSDFRPLNHFFDPAHNSPLTIGGVTGGTPVGKKNPDWALGTIDAFNDSNASDSQRRNHFSVADAREAMWRALTLTDKNLVPVDSLNSLTKEQIRMAYWATTFRALGDLVHLIQDMAQPQHARNEPHNGLGSQSIQQNFTGHGSILENYLDARAGGDDSFTVTGSSAAPKIKRAALRYTGYSTIPTFARYIDYFSTSPGSNSNAGYGMADHANRQFFSEAKNLGSSDLTRPSNDPSAYSTCPTTATNWDGSPLPNGVLVKLLCATPNNPYVDELNGQRTPGILMTSDSAWNLFVPNSPRYHLTKENFDQQATLLIPRGTAYSAGLINFFLRGQMNIAPPDDGIYAYVDHSRFSGANASSSTDIYNGFKGFTKIRLKLTNTTAAIQTPTGTVAQTMGTGKVVAVVKFHRNKCYTDDLSAEPLGKTLNDCRVDLEEIVRSQSVSVVDSISSDPSNPTVLEFPFVDNEIPINAMDAYLQVVFRGQLGQEADAVAVATNDISEPTYLALTNSADYIWINGRVETYGQLAGDSPALATLLSVSPECFDGNQQLKNAQDPNRCFPLSNLTALLTLQVGIGSTAIKTPSLAVGAYVRVAYLTDVTATPKVSLTGCQWPTTDIPPLQQEKIVSADGSALDLFDTFQTNRGIWGSAQLDCVYDGDNTTIPKGLLPGMTALPDLRPQAIDSTAPTWQ